MSTVETPPMADRLTADALGVGPPYRTAQAVIADRLRRAILAGELPPRQRLLQDAIAKQVGTSTTPVREALRELVGEGLVDFDPHRGVVVHECRIAELEEIYQVRMLLEPVAIAATTMHISLEELIAAERILDRMERESEIAEWVIMNAAFHSLLAEASRSPILTSVLRKLRNISALYVASSLHKQMGRIATGNREHRALLEACKSRDVARAQEAQVIHLRQTLALSLERFPSVVGTFGEL
jgi:DNA-binding GntR family transcriptional regulator